MVEFSRPQQKPLEMLQVAHFSENESHIVTPDGKPTVLRGVGIAHMNWENFIQGFPGTENRLRAEVVRQMGRQQGQEFLDGIMDAYFTKQDAQAIGALKDQNHSNDPTKNVHLVARYSVNYRHFEDDERPGVDKQEGFTRLNNAIEWLGDNNVYTIVDLHATPGWQNADWHSDNHVGTSLLWHDRNFQDRTVRLWRKLAKRYRGDPNIAAFDLINEIASEQPGYDPDWDAVNSFIARLVTEIREEDPDRILSIGGECYGGRFYSRPEDKNVTNGRIIIPDDPNIIISTHAYNPAQIEGGPYARGKKQRIRDRAHSRKSFYERQQGYPYAQEQGRVLYVGEFGAVFSNNPDEVPDRIRAAHDQMEAMNDVNASWSGWHYKEKAHIGLLYSSMGLYSTRPYSRYNQTIEPTERRKIALRTDWWMGQLEPERTQKEIERAADAVYEVVYPSQDNKKERDALRDIFKKKAAGIATRALQEQWVQSFVKLSDDERQEAVDSWRLENCTPHQAYIDVIKKNINA